MNIDNPTFPPFSKEEYRRRLAAIQQAMRKRQLDCLVLYGGDHAHGSVGSAHHVVYLANYAGMPSSYLVVPREGEPTLIVRLLVHLENARAISSVEDIRTGFSSIEITVAECLRELGLHNGAIGVVGSATIPTSYSLPYEHQRHLADTFPAARFENVNTWFADQRSIKSDEELLALEKAGRLVAHGYEHMILSTQRGVRHCDITAKVEMLALTLGGSCPLSFFGSTPMGESGQSYPDPYPSTRAIEDGHVVMTELAYGLGANSAKVMGTYFVGTPNQLYRDLFGAAAAAYRATVDALEPGMKGRDVAKFLAPVRDAGFTTIGPLINGWGGFMERPRVGVLADSRGAEVEQQGDLDWEFAAGQTLYVTGRAATKDHRAGVWVGASQIMTDTGLRSIVPHPVDEIRVV